MFYTPQLVLNSDLGDEKHPYTIILPPPCFTLQMLMSTYIMYMITLCSKTLKLNNGLIRPSDTLQYSMVSWILLWLLLNIVLNLINAVLVQIHLCWYTVSVRLRTIKHNTKSSFLLQNLVSFQYL